MSVSIRQGQEVISSDFSQIQNRGRYYGFGQFLKFFSNVGKKSGFLFNLRCFIHFLAQGFTQGSSLPNFSQIKLLISLQPAQSFEPRFWAKTSDQALKNHNFEKNVKKNQGSRVQNFSQIRPFLKSSLPQSFFFWTDRHTLSYSKLN